MPFRPPFYLISDTHFLHRKMTEYEPIRAALKPDQNRAMITRWNEVVGEHDVIVHLGDLMLGSDYDFEPIADALQGVKYLVKGNHDRKSKKWYRQNGFHVIPPFWLEYRDWSIRFSHEPEPQPYPRHVNVHGHVHSEQRPDRKTKQHAINVSVEVMEFRPVLVADLLDGYIAAHDC